MKKHPVCIIHRAWHPNNNKKNTSQSTIINRIWDSTKQNKTGSRPNRLSNTLAGPGQLLVYLLSSRFPPSGTDDRNCTNWKSSELETTITRRPNLRFPTIKRRLFTRAVCSRAQSVGVGLGIGREREGGKGKRGGKERGGQCGEGGEMVRKGGEGIFARQRRYCCYRKICYPSFSFFVKKQKLLF